MKNAANNCLLLILLISGRAVHSTIFDRDRTGEAQELESRIRRIDDQIADLRPGIEQDIRVTLLNLKSTADRVPIAQQGQDLSERELKLTQDRFRSGVTNNIEVITPKDERARAGSYILAVSSYVHAKYALAQRRQRNRNTNIDQYLAP